MKLSEIWFCGNRSMAKAAVAGHDSHIYQSAGGGHRGPQGLLAGSDG